MTLSIGAFAHVEPGTSPDTGVTPSVNTQATGSTFLVLSVSGSGAVPTVTDNKGNTYNTSKPLISYTGTVNGDTFYVSIAYCENGVGGTGHTTTTNFSTTGHPHGTGSVYFIEIHDTVAYPTLDVQASANDSASPYTASITTLTANSLVLAFCGSDQTATTTKTVASPFTKFDEDTNGGSVYIGALASCIVASPGAQGVSWTATNALDTINLLLAYKSNAAAGSTSGTVAATAGAASAAGVASSTATGAAAATASPATGAASGTGSGASGSSAVGAATAGQATVAGVVKAISQAIASAIVGTAIAAGSGMSGSSSGVPTLGAHTLLAQPDSGGSSPAVTSGINTQASGSAFFTILGGFAYTHTPTDTFGNTYTQQGVIENWNNQFPNEALKAFVSYGSGGTGHQLSLVKDASWVSRELTMPFIEIKNAVSCTQTQHYVGSASTNVCPPVTVTGPALLIAIWSGDSAANGLTMTAVPDSGFSVIESYLVIPNASGCQMAVAVLQVASAGSYGLTWTETPTQGAEVAIFAFEGGVVTSNGVGAATAGNAVAAGIADAVTQAAVAATVAHDVATSSGFSTSTGSGAAAASSTVANGSASVTAMGVGAGQAQPDTAAGSGGSGATAGVGSAQANNASASAFAFLASAGSGAVNVSGVIASAAASTTSVSVGAAAASSAIAQGFAGLSPSIGAGVATANPAAAAGIAQAITQGAGAAFVAPATAAGQARAFTVATGSINASAAIAAGVAGSGSSASIGSGAVTVAAALASGNGVNTTLGNVMAFAQSAIARGFAGEPLVTEPSRIVLLPAENRTVVLSAEPRVVVLKD